MIRGTVRDIRTGRALGSTDDLTTTFIDHIVTLRQAGQDCYVVCGPCRHSETRWGLDRMREAGITVIHDRQFKPDTYWLFSGHPSELGFTASG